MCKYFSKENIYKIDGVKKVLDRERKTTQDGQKMAEMLSLYDFKSKELKGNNKVLDRIETKQSMCVCS